MQTAKHTDKKYAKKIYNSEVWPGRSNKKSHRISRPCKFSFHLSWGGEFTSVLMFIQEDNSCPALLVIIRSVLIEAHPKFVFFRGFVQIDSQILSFRQYTKIKRSDWTEKRNAVKAFELNSAPRTKSQHCESAPTYRLVILFSRRCEPTAAILSRLISAAALTVSIEGGVGPRSRYRRLPGRTVGVVGDDDVVGK